MDNGGKEVDLSLDCGSVHKDEHKGAEKHGPNENLPLSHNEGLKSESNISESESQTTCSLLPPSLDSVKELEKKFQYLKFQDYDFSKDDQFQVGWKKLSAVVPPGQFDQQFLKAKLFYYSKHIEPINVNDYLTWRETYSKTHNNKGQDQSPNKEDNADCDKGENSSSSDVLEPPPTSSDSASLPLTFSDVLEIIQSGKTIPGLKTLDIKPTDTQPSPSLMNRKSKPWES